MEYSNTFFRGLSSEDYLVDGVVNSAAFQFKYDEPLLTNGYAPLSICWEDDKSVIELMFRQKKKDNDSQPQFRLGIARFQRDSIDRINKLPAFRGILSYERAPLGDNPYHGNVLASAAASKTQRKLLPAVIASEWLDIIPRNKK